MLFARVAAHHFLAPAALEPGVGSTGTVRVDIRDGDAAVAADNHRGERDVLAFFIDEVAGEDVELPDVLRGGHVFLGACDLPGIALPGDE